MKQVSKLILSFMATVIMASSALAQNLKTKVYNPGHNAIFDITSVIVYGEKDAILIDAQFQKQYALELIKEIKATGKNLKTVYISHSDPDFYFGLDEIRTAFPKAEIISTAQTAYLIEASKDGKMAVWGPQLKADAPTEIIVPKAVTSIPDLEGHKLEIVTIANDPAHSFVWIPSLKTVAGGISVGTDTHLWMADTKGYTGIDQWIAQIDKMRALKPVKVIPSHYMKLNDSPKVLDFVKGYLTDYKAAAKNTATGEELAEKMIVKYPTLEGADNLKMGAKVFKGEMDWEVASPFPSIGQKIIARFSPEFQFELEFIDNKQLKFTGITKETKGTDELVNYKAVEVAPNVFMLYWYEPKTTKANIVHIENWNTKQIFTNVANPDGTSQHYSGTFEVKR